jgi:hypothetical protein
MLGARVIPLPHPQGTLLVYANDSDGSAIEVWPASLRGEVGAHELQHRDAALPEAWPHHSYVTSESFDVDRVLAIFEREGWTAQQVHNGPPSSGFSLVRGWIENHTGIELGGSAMRAEYEQFFSTLRRGASATTVIT